MVVISTWRGVDIIAYHRVSISNSLGGSNKRLNPSLYFFHDPAKFNNKREGGSQKSTVKFLGQSSPNYSVLRAQRRVLLAFLAHFPAIWNRSFPDTNWYLNLLLTTECRVLHYIPMQKNSLAVKQTVVRGAHQLPHSFKSEEGDAQGGNNWGT